MRTRGTLFHPTTLVSQTPTAEATTAAATTTFSPPATIERSPWHSPVPYLFGGLSAMLGLIVFALLILACSYWKLSGGGGGRDVDGDNGSDAKAMPVFEDKFLVIMAGDVKPTFLATPMMSTKTTSFNDEQVECKENGKEEKIDKQKDCDEQTSHVNGEEAIQFESHLSQQQISQ